MDITIENLRKFVQAHGAVSIADTTGKTQRLNNGSPDLFELAAKADRFRFEGSWHNRAEFGRIMDQRMNPKPMNAYAVPMDVLAEPKKQNASAQKRPVSYSAYSARTKKKVSAPRRKLSGDRS